MSTQTLLYIILAGIVALLLALFQYKYKTKGASKSNALFAFLRFITLFSVLLLLINPKFEQVKYYTEKPNLVVAVDNSASIKHLKQEENAKVFLNSITNNSQLKDKFNIEVFAFGNTLNTSDSLSFTETQTHLDKVFKQLGQVYKNTISPTILVTDGNQTIGNDYQFSAKKYNQAIYPVILGDTVVYSDLQITKLNVNKYAYLKNKFPVEAIVVYNGEEEVTSKFVVTKSNTTVYSKVVKLDKSNNSEVLNFTLSANSVGVQSYKAQIIPLSIEKNKTNNYKNFAVEIIDQKSKIAIVSTVLHPDLGALKKSIESNEQREVVFLKPNKFLDQINDFQLVILYQPNNSFKSVFEALEQQNTNKWIISGPNTDWNFVNSTSKNYRFLLSFETEDYQPSLNTNYSSFILDDLNFESFPPLQSTFGEAYFNVPFEVILFKKLSGIKTEQPLLATLETNGRREALLFGQGIWKWRAQSYLNDDGFLQFDNFIGKLVQYLASNKRKNRLNIDYNSFYNGSDNIVISAQFFNKNYEFDANASLSISLKNKDSGQTLNRPFILKGNNYKVNLSGLEAGNYNFTVSESSENVSVSGGFKIIEYNVEQQFLNADVTKLKQVAINSNGNAYFVSDYNALVQSLLDNNRYQSIQKSNKSVVPLIDWYYLLFIITLSLALEWFIRKYQGLI
ncbi:VWA domain-containing protein [Olleya sp. HaHaR_3_96]|uniref:VWA domain-containing protein n=1 Tax=Olleya sp. HaHaR_3_96 TaxID=2745560 RepID=UPI001C4EF249|nr:VWA domain-containing protein [Olleya sp. HaHaR_3_96]QXP58939.1 VWA domain-containing protein [Olleya sp. HaHaR_3_96]